MKMRENSDFVTAVTAMMEGSLSEKYVSTEAAYIQSKRV